MIRAPDPAATVRQDQLILTRQGAIVVHRHAEGAGRAQDVGRDDCEGDKERDNHDYDASHTRHAVTEGL